MLTNRDALLEAWRIAAETLAKAKDYEAELRVQVVEAYSTNTDELASGVENVDIGWGHNLKITHGVTRKFDSPDAAVNAEMLISQILGEELSSRLIKWKPELSIGEYNKAPAEVKAVIDRATVVRPSMKQIAIAKRK